MSGSGSSSGSDSPKPAAAAASPASTSAAAPAADAAPAPENLADKIYKEGQLTKRSGGGKVVKTWRVRHFELRHGSLHYFKGKGKEEMGFFPLAGCVVLPANNIRKPHAFQIHHPLRRTYYCSAPTAADKEEWMGAITQRITAANVDGGKERASASPADRILYVHHGKGKQTAETPAYLESLTGAARRSETMKKIARPGSVVQSPAEPPKSRVRSTTQNGTPLKSLLKLRPNEVKRRIVWAAQLTEGPSGSRASQKPKGDEEEDSDDDAAPGDDEDDGVVEDPPILQDTAEEHVPTKVCNIPEEEVRANLDPTRSLLKEIDPDESMDEKDFATATGNELSTSKEQRLLFAGWVSQVNQEKKIMERRILVLLEFEFILLKVSENKKKGVLFDVPYFSIQIIQSYNPDDMRVEWTENSVILAASDSRTRAVIRILLSAINGITHGWLEEQMVEVDISRLLPPITYPIDTRLGGLIPTMKAYCVLLKVPFPEAFLTHLASLKSNETTLDLATSFGGTQVDLNVLKALCLGLANNQQITELDLTTVQSKGFAGAAALMFRTNTMLRTMTLANMGISMGWWELGVALRGAEAMCGLRVLDLSGNPIPEKGLAAVAVGVSHLGLESLSLANCSLSPKAFGVLADALLQRPSQACTGSRLTSLNISDNRAGSQGAASLGTWLKTTTALREFKAAYTGLDVYEFSTNLIPTAATLGLKTLDLKGAVIEKRACTALTELIIASSVTDLDISEAKISKQGVGQLFDALVSGNAEQTSFSASHVEVADEGVQALVKVIDSGVKLNSLILEESKLKTEGCCALLQALANCPTLQRICISGNMKARTLNTDVAIQLLVDLLVSTKHQVTYIGVAGDHKHFLGPSVMPLMNAVAQSRTLRELDVSKNRCPEVIELLAKALTQPACRLATVNFDENGTTLAGLRAFKAALANNTSLVSMTAPINDLRELAKKCTKGPATTPGTRAELDALLESIQALMDRNATSQSRRPIRDFSRASLRVNIDMESLAAAAGDTRDDRASSIEADARPIRAAPGTEAAPSTPTTNAAPIASAAAAAPQQAAGGSPPTVTAGSPATSSHGSPQPGPAPKVESDTESSSSDSGSGE